MRYIILGRCLSLRVSSPVFRLFKKISKRKTPQGLWEMWKSFAALGRDFSRRRWESAIYLRIPMDAVFSIRPCITSFLPTDCAKEPIKEERGRGKEGKKMGRMIDIGFLSL
jgi:hypothetical protein